MAVKKNTRRKKSAAKASAKARTASVRIEVPAEPITADETPVDGQPGDASTRSGWTRMLGAGAAFAAVAAIAGVVMFGGRDSAAGAEAAAVAAQPEAPAAPPQPVKPIRAIAGVPGKKTPPKARPATAAGSPAVPRTASEIPDAVMIEGCLEQTGQTFRLKDTSGEGAPRSRSWKSGFLKKRTRPVDVVDWNNRLKDHVGERVSVSGMFVDGEMRVSTLRRVAVMCN
jgi:hypothetical protein